MYATQRIIDRPCIVVKSVQYSLNTIARKNIETNKKSLNGKQLTVRVCSLFPHHHEQAIIFFLSFEFCFFITFISSYTMSIMIENDDKNDNNNDENYYFFTLNRRWELFSEIHAFTYSLITHLHMLYNTLYLLRRFFRSFYNLSYCQYHYANIFVHVTFIAILYDFLIKKLVFFFLKGF